MGLGLRPRRASERLPPSFGRFTCSRSTRRRPLRSHPHWSPRGRAAAQCCAATRPQRRTAKLAPYDLIVRSNLRSGRLTPGANIGGSFLAPDFHGKQWKAFAEATWLSPASTVKRVGQLAAKVDQVCGDVPQQIVTGAGDPARVLERIVHEVRKRCRRILTQL
jgi:hypothetical protein